MCHMDLMGRKLYVYERVSQAFSRNTSANILTILREFSGICKVRTTPVVFYPRFGGYEWPDYVPNKYVSRLGEITAPCSMLDFGTRRAPNTYGASSCSTWLKEMGSVLRDSFGLNSSYKHD
jgi:hypothetical protein